MIYLEGKELVGLESQFCKQEWRAVQLGSKAKGTIAATARKMLRMELRLQAAGQNSVASTMPLLKVHVLGHCFSNV